MKIITFSLALALILSLQVSRVEGQTRGTPPPNPVIIKTDLSHSWYLKIVIDGRARTVSSSVKTSSHGFMVARQAAIAIADCAQMADVLEAAAAAIRTGRQFVSRQFGDLWVMIGTRKVDVDGQIGESNTEEHTVVIVHGGQSGLFLSPIEMVLLPENAEEFAKSLRTAPDIHARLQLSIAFDTIWRAK